MTNRKRISALIKANFPDIEVYCEQIGDMVKKIKMGLKSKDILLLEVI